MLGVIGLILKIIGIIIGVLLGIFIVAVLCILFIPVRYKAIFVKTGGQYKLEVRVSWLLHLLGCRFGLEGKDKRLRIRILGIPFYDTSRPKKESKRNKKIDDSDSGNHTTEKKEPDPVLQKTNQKIDTHPIDKKVTKVNKKQDEENQSSDTETDQVKSEQDDTTEDVGKIGKLIQKIINKITNMYHSIIKKIKDFMKKIKDLFDNIQKLKDNINKVKELMWNDEKKKVYGHSFGILKKILKHVFPRKCKAEITFGTGDPYSTGRVFTYLGMFYGMYGKDVHIYADFEEKCLEADAKVKGRIRMFTLLVFALRLYNKELRATIKDAKNIKEIFG